MLFSIIRESGCGRNMLSTSNVAAMEAGIVGTGYDNCMEMDL